MDRIYIKGHIKLEDVEEINKIAPVIVEIDSTVNQSSILLNKISDDCIIRIIPDGDILGYEEASNRKLMTYSKSAFVNLLKVYDDIESGINPNWTDLEKATYIYRILQETAHVSKTEYPSTYDLSGVLKGQADSAGLASIFYEMMKRNNIPCKYVYNSNFDSWNEIRIKGEYYPLDLAKDSDEFTSNNPLQRPVFNNFLSNVEFYDMPEHTTEIVDTKSRRALPREEVERAIDTVFANEANSEKEESREGIPPRPIERKRVEIKSKELAGIFSGNEITEETIKQELPELKINVSDNDFGQLESELEEISTYYPELLERIEITNNTSSHISMQEVIDKVYEVQSLGEYSRAIPINLTISSNIAEDFDLDFTKAPKVQTRDDYKVDGTPGYQTISFRNTDPNTSVLMPNLASKLSENIGTIAFEGMDLQNVEITYESKKRKIIFKGGNLENLSAVRGLDRAYEIEIDGISDSEFDQFMSSMYLSCRSLIDISVNGQQLQNRTILRELAANPNVSRVSVTNSNLNNIEGVEDFDGRIGLLNLMQNDLDLRDLERVSRIYQNNPYLMSYLNHNTGIRDAITRAPEISDESFDYMKKIYFDSGALRVGNRSSFSKADAVDYILWSYPNIPYYIKDAEIIRDNIGIKTNPLMIESNSDIDNIDFSKPYLQGAKLLLTIPQIEYLLNSGKVIPQEVIVKVKDVSELSSTALRNLSARMNAVGMNISGVQIIDENFDNWKQQLEEYNTSEYIYIRDTLDRLVRGIDSSESDLDKYVTVYTRLADSISYDLAAASFHDFPSSMYLAQRVNECRNLKEGLIEGKTVCAGYADILRNALSLVGIRSRLVTGLADASDRDTAHAWNQVEIKDEHGNGKWYYTDLTWDRKKGMATAPRDQFDWMLLGTDHFVRHEKTYTQDIENVERDDYDRAQINDAIRRLESRRFDFTEPEITIPEDPTLSYTLDNQRIADEYQRRRDDMFAKFYGDKDYEAEYLERSERFKSNEVEVTSGGITYRTVNDYPEKEDDERFLLLDGYQKALERMTRFDAGDTSVYNGLSVTYDEDKEYVETRNHTFNQHEYTQNDLTTLGKYGEKMPYIPRQQGILKNAGRVVLNAGILMRNIVAPVYRFIGKNIAKPLHRAITRGKDASPYKNNAYHRMVARRDYFADMARRRDEEETERLRAAATDPASINPVRHPFKNALEARFKALFRVEEGNEAVLRAGAADIKRNIINQERNTVLVNALNVQIREYEMQIRTLQDSLRRNSSASNKPEVEAAIISKQNALANARRNLDTIIQNGPINSEQTDAIDDRQHAVASKEVNTMRTTVIKGFAKGLAVRYIGPKIHDWILEHSKVTTQVEVPAEETIQTEEWIPTTYKTETVPVYDDVIDKSKTLDELMASNSGKEVTGFYSVYGGERAPATYTLTGDEKITAIFHSVGNGGHGLSDTVGLKAPTLTDGSFASDMLENGGVLSQNITVDELVNAVNDGTIDANTLSDLYVSVGDRYWTKLSDLVPGITEKVKVDEIVKTVVDREGHYETVSEVVETVKTVNETVVNPTVERGTKVVGDILKGAVAADGVLDVAENLRKTNTSKRSNKRQAREYDFDDEGTQNIPKSRKEYRRNSGGDER